MNKKIDCIFYLVDDYLYLYLIKKKLFKEYKLNNYIFEGRIIKPKNFINILLDILKKEKVYKILSSLNTIIIYNPNLKYIDKKIIIDSFSECNFKDIKLVNTKQLLNKNKYYIEINNNSLIVYYNNRYTFIRFNDYININTLLKIIVKKINKDIIFVGINNNIKELVNMSINIYYLENSKTYYIDKIIEKKKN